MRTAVAWCGFFRLLVMQTSEEILSNYLKFKTAQKQKRLSLLWITCSLLLLLLLHFLGPFLEQSSFFPFSTNHSSIGKLPFTTSSSPSSHLSYSSPPPSLPPSWPCLLLSCYHLPTCLAPCLVLLS